MNWRIASAGHAHDHEIRVWWTPIRDMLGSERLTGALLYRLTHHVHILGMNGDSYRLKDSKRKRAAERGK